MKSIQKKVESIFRTTLRNQLSRRSAPLKIIAAFSGGPDSTVLLFLLHRFRSEFGYDLEAAYVNHGIRRKEETVSEEEKVIKTASDLCVPLHIKSFSPGFLKYFSRLMHCGVEAGARTYRYHFFKRLLYRSDGHSCLALGHNRNDQEETIIMRLFSGSGVEGLRGIPESSDSLIRPLININREDIEAYLRSLDLSSVLDSSNLESEYLRNRVRHDLITQIHNIFPEGQQSLLRLGREVNDVLDHYNELLEKQCPWTLKENRWICLEKDFLKLPSPSRRNMVLKRINYLSENSHPDNRIPRLFFNPLDEMDKDRRIILKGYGILFFRERDRLVLSTEVPPSPWENLFFHLNRHYPFVCEYFSLILTDLSSAEDDETVIILPEDVKSILVRSPLSTSEKRKYSRNGRNPIVYLCGEEGVVACLDSGGKIVFYGANFKKRLKNDPSSNHQCVIIKYRGDHAPG